MAGKSLRARPTHYYYQRHQVYIMLDAFCFGISQGGHKCSLQEQDGVSTSRPCSPRFCTLREFKGSHLTASRRSHTPVTSSHGTRSPECMFGRARLMVCKRGRSRHPVKQFLSWFVWLMSPPPHRREEEKEIPGRASTGALAARCHGCK